MSNSYFQFKMFTVHQERSAMKVTTDSCLFGSWIAHVLQREIATGNLLDIGTGTGLLSMMVAQKNALQITAVEINAEAAQQAMANISHSPFKGQIKVIHSDINTFPTGEKYDYIISNPPFYEKDLRSPDRFKNIAHHSSMLSLSGLLQQIGLRIKKTGSFFLLLPAEREQDLQKMGSETGMFISHKICVHQTENHHKPFRIMIRCSFQQQEVHTASIYIKESGVYSSRFTALLKDYYLHL